MRTPPAFALAALAALPALAAPACGDDASDASALAGLYEVTSWTESTTGCTGTPTPVTTSTHLFIKVASFFGQETLQVESCAQAQGCGTDPEAFPEFTFFSRSSAQWFTQAASSSYLAPTCALGLSVQTLKTTAEGIHIESTMSTGDFELTQDECTTDAAKAKQATLTCASKTVVDARRPGAATK